MNEPSILLVAPFDDGEHAHAAQRVRAFERLGCDVTTYDLRKKTGLFAMWGGADQKSRLIRSVADAEADLVLVIGGYDLGPDLLDAVRTATGVKLVNWFPDDMDRIDEILAVARAYDDVFVAGSDVAAACERSFGRKVEVLPLAADPSVYRPMKSRDQYRANVVFAGSATAIRERFLNEVVEFGLALWGPGWRRTGLRDYCRGEVRNTEEFVRAYGGATVAINLHHGLDAGGRSYGICNQRVFELSAMGLPQVVDARSDLPTFFEVGTEILTFGSEAELRERVNQVLHTPHLADELGAAARRRVLGSHTYMHRARRLLDAVGLPVPAVRGAEGESGGS